jgi:hypothetical protein
MFLYSFVTCTLREQVYCSTFPAQAMHDSIFCFERSDKKYYGVILSPAANFLLSFLC